MKKKIVIVTRRMIMGGIEKALISMLNAIPKDKYEITVLVMGYGGELENEIPEHVKVECLYGNENNTLEKLWKYAKRGEFIRALIVGSYTLQAKMAKNIFKQELYHSKMIQKIETEYDLAIAYHGPASFPVVFVINNIKAKLKIAWIHADVSWFANQLQPYKEFYHKYDKIFCVSKYAMHRFNDLFPDLKEKTSVFYNIVDKNELEILSATKEGFNDQFRGIRILTVGRLSPEKGQDIIPKILKELRTEGFNVRWYCIGDGENRRQLENIIKKYGLEKHLILLGTKCNPYKYISQCDIYVQPSRHEGYCISLAEARAFNKPIITTDFVGAREQIENGHNGLIVDFDENEIFSAIKTLINNQKLSVMFEENLKRANLDTTNEINKLLDRIC